MKLECPLQISFTSWQTKVLRLCAILILLVVGLEGLHSSPARVEAQASGGWIMAYFREAPDSYNVHMAYSTNGLNWTTLNNNNPILRLNDGSSIFSADATWYRRPGLANSGWSSYESYNYPGQYMRHYSYLLILGAVSGSTQQADATFREQ